MPWYDMEQSTCRGYSFYYGEMTEFRGEMEWFAKMAAAILKWFIHPMDKQDHRRLRMEMEYANSLGSLLNVGFSKGRLPIIRLYILAGFFLTVFLIAFGVHKRFSKKRIFDSKTALRKQCALSFTVVPIALLTIFFGYGFSTSMWATYEISRRAGEAQNILPRLPLLESQLLSSAQCEFNNMTTEKEAMKSLIRKIEANFSYPCETEKLLKKRLELIEREADSLDDVINFGEPIMTELTKIKSNAKVIENSKRMELEKAVTGFNMTMEILKKLKKKMKTTVMKESEDLLNAVLNHEKRLKDTFKTESEEFMNVLDNTTDRYKTVKDSLDISVKFLCSYITRIATRWTQVNNQGKEPVLYFVLVQVTVAIAALLPVFSLYFGLLATTMFIFHPSAIHFFPNFSKNLLKKLFFSFVCTAVLTLVIFIFSGLALSFSAPATSVCSTLNDFNHRNQTSPGLSYLNSANLSLVLDSYDGEKINIGLGEVIDNNNNYAFANVGGNRRKNLYPDWSDEEVKKFINKWEKMERPIEEVVIPDNKKFLRSLGVSLFSLEIIFPNEVFKEVQIFKRLIKRLNLTTLETTTIHRNPMYFPTNENKEAIMTSYYNAFYKFRNKLVTELYRIYAFPSLYRGASFEMCINWRVGASGMWFASMMLGTLLIVNLLLLAKLQSLLKEIIFSTTISDAAPLVSNSLVEKENKVSS